MKNLSLAIIGGGKWGYNHVRVYSELSEMGLCDELILCDHNQETLNRITAQYNIHDAFSNIDEMLKEKTPDAAIIASPTDTHYELAMKLLPFSHLFIEKPIALTLHDAKHILETAKKHKKFLQVGHIERFNPAVTALKTTLQELIEDEPIIDFFSKRIGPGPPSPKSYHGVGFDLLIHDIDICMYLFDSKPTFVTAVEAKPTNFLYASELQAIYTFEIPFNDEGILLANLRASYRANPNLKQRFLTIQTYSRTITMDYVLQSVVELKGQVPQSAKAGFMDVMFTYLGREQTERFLFTKDRVEPLYLQDKHFLESLHNNRAPEVDGIVGTNALRCILSAIESAKTGEVTRINWE
ncbi:MAG: Gfo/Idh/MocA family oxidoreductase [Candidatus Heimdallarchaeota archaeon]